MNPAELFRQESNTVQLAPGDFLFREGEIGDKMYVLLEGEIDIFLGDFVLETAGPGALLGEMALIDDNPRTANAVAKTPVQAGPNRSAPVSLSRSADAAFCDACHENSSRSPASHERCNGCSITSLVGDVATSFGGVQLALSLGECASSRSLCWVLRLLRPAAGNRSRQLPISRRSGSGWWSNS